MFLNTKNMAIKQYINETRAEMKHVTWPTTEQTLAYSVIVIVVSVAIAAWLGVFDSIFAAGIKAFIPGL